MHCLAGSGVWATAVTASCSDRCARSVCGPVGILAPWSFHRCAQPRMLVLIMPRTNFHPQGYELIYHDDRLCSGAVFYAPGVFALMCWC